MPSFFLLDEIQKFNHSRLVHFSKIKINLNFHFCTFLWCLKGFMHAFMQDRRKTWGTTKKCGNENLSWFSLFIVDRDVKG